MKKINIILLLALILGLTAPNFSLATTSTQADSLSSPYLFALAGQSDTEGSVNFDIYASFNRVISGAYRSGIGLQKAIMTFYPFNGSEVKECTYDLLANTNDCNLPDYLTTASGQVNNQAVVKINFASSTNTLEKVKFHLYYATSTNPTGYTFNVGDSISNDGWGGDASTQSNDAEMQIYNTTLDAYGNDQASIDGVNRNIVHLSNVIHQGAFVVVTVKNNYLGWEIENIGSTTTDIQISNLMASNITANGAKFSWDTNVPTAMDFGYKKSTDSQWTWSENQILETHHEKTFTNFDPNTAYNYQVRVRDNLGQLITSSEIKSFTTLPVIAVNKPDLIIDKVTLLTTGESNKSDNANQDVSFNVIIKNIGDTTTTSTFYVSGEVPPYTSNSFQHRQSKSVSGVLSANATKEVVIGPLQLPLGQIVKDPARFYVDKDLLNSANNDLVIESREDNNAYEFNFCEDADSQFKCKPSIFVTDDEATSTTDSSAEEIQSGNIKVLRDKIKEQEMEIKYLKNINKDLSKLNELMKEKLSQFMAYGVDDNTQKLGEGERAAVLYSYQQAFGNLPQTDADLNDVVRIANGRWPSMKNKSAEEKATAKFKEIYQRDPNLNNPNDNAAVVIMAYGLRQKAENRKLNSEQKGLKIFDDLFGKIPSSTEEWNTLQAITYSGATREIIDSDNDGLSDNMEKKFGTDPNNSDTDGDGYLDGQEVVNNYNPLKK